MSRAIVGRKPKLTAAQRARLFEWARNRKTRAEIAAELGVSVSTLGYYLRDQRKNFRACP